jgi:hypothetical protein
MASSGFAGGDPERVLGMRADLVMLAVEYEAFKVDYERAYIEMNRTEARK